MNHLFEKIWFGDGNNYFGDLQRDGISNFVLRNVGDGIEKEGKVNGFDGGR